MSQQEHNFQMDYIEFPATNIDATKKFYTQVFGAREYARDENSIQALGPGPHDLLAFERRPEKAGAKGGIGHFGFRLVDVLCPRWIVEL